MKYNLFYDAKCNRKFESDCEFYDIIKCTIISDSLKIESEQPGVYIFAYWMGALLYPYYVGSAGNLKKRIRRHKEYEPTSGILFVELPDKKLAGRVEMDWIAMFSDTLKNNMKTLRGAMHGRT